MNKAKLIFSKDGTSVHIVFSNGKESLEFESRKQVLSAINACHTISKISEEEKDELVKAVLLEKRLPENGSETFIIAIVIVAKNDDDKEDVKTIDNPDVHICNCGELPIHAYVYDDNNEKVGLPFLTKEEGYVLVKHLLDSKRITDGNAARLNTLIDLLHIPETASMN
jgi:hypothetical protein